MKLQELKKEIRKIVKEELYDVLGDVLPSLLSEVVAEHIVPQQPRSQQRRVPSPKQPVLNTKNPLLNEVLSLTKGGISDGSELVGLDGEFQIPGQQFQGPGVYQDEGVYDDNDFESFSVGDHGQKVDIEAVASVAPEVAKALTRDYSSLLKAVDRKRVTSGPSNIDFSKL